MEAVIIEIDSRVIDLDDRTVAEGRLDGHARKEVLAHGLDVGEDVGVIVSGFACCVASNGGSHDLLEELIF